MIQVHHLNNSRSQRILWLLEELNVPYEIVSYMRDATTRRAPPELRKIHALGKSPVITDGGETIAESGAIIDYLARKYGAGKFIPKEGTPEFRQYTYWMHYAEGSAMTPLLLKLYTGFLGAGAAPLQPLIDGDIANHLSYMDEELGSRRFFVGDQLTGADFQMVFVLEAAAARAPLKDYPNLSRYLKAMHERPAYKRGIERGGPYELMRPSA